MTIIDTPPRLLTVQEVAKTLRQSPVSVYRHIREGRLPARRICPTGPLRVRADELDAFLAEAVPAGRAHHDEEASE
jgi:excisionase family DNA binding protein